MRLFRLLPIMHIGVVRTSLYADLARSLALHCLIGTLAVLPWHLNRELRRPPAVAPNGMGELVSYRHAGSDSACCCLALEGGRRIARELKEVLLVMLSKRTMLVHVALDRERRSSLNQRE
ncbi:hypothetical protein HDV57DRAFT_356661 [Trichoderma longibrachiatum]